MKILVIDDSSDFRALLRLYLYKEIKGVEIIEYDIDALGRPADTYDWSPYDVLLLDYKLGETEDGLEWLKAFRKKPGFPPTIILTAEGDEYVAIRSVKLGAADYINKKDISPRRLKELVEEAIDFSPTTLAEQEQIAHDASQIIQRIKIENEALPGDGLDIGYRFIRHIGQGAMSHVYLAERVSDKHSLVLKVLDLTNVRNEVLIVRFMQEAKLVAELNSPFVVKFYEHGLTKSYGYIAMEFFSRGDLKQRMELNFSTGVAFNYMIHITYGLDAIHNINIVHRDLKPANIMFRGDDTLALADFGISKDMSEDNDLTTIGQVLGTPHYMSPEQGQGKDIDNRSDLYSAGILLYELLTKERPFNAKTAAALIYQHIHGDIPKLPAKLSQHQHIINKILAKDPAERYQTAAEFIQVLEAARREYL